MGLMIKGTIPEGTTLFPMMVVYLTYLLRRLHRRRNLDPFLLPRISTALVPACSLPPIFSISTMVSNILWKLRSVHASICKTGFQPRFFPLDAKCTVLSSLSKPSILDHVHHQTSLLALPLNLASFVEISAPLCAGYHQHLQQAGRRV